MLVPCFYLSYLYIKPKGEGSSCPAQEGRGHLWSAKGRGSGHLWSALGGGVIYGQPKGRGSGHLWSVQGGGVIYSQPKGGGVIYGQPKGGGVSLAHILMMSRFNKHIKLLMSGMCTHVGMQMCTHVGMQMCTQ